MSSRNSRICVSWRGAEYHRSNTLISQSAYPPPGGGAVQLACGSSRSITGGLKVSSASYVSTGLLRVSIVHSRPL